MERLRERARVSDASDAPCLTDWLDELDVETLKKHSSMASREEEQTAHAAWIAPDNASEPAPPPRKTALDAVQREQVDRNYICDTHVAAPRAHAESARRCTLHAPTTRCH